MAVAVRWRAGLLALSCVAGAALLGGPVGAAGADTGLTCRGWAVTIVAAPGQPVHGTAGRDVIAGTDGNDIIYAGDGPDLVCGGPGADIIHGGPRRDDIFGGNGNDEIFGGRAYDNLSGGAGNDILRGQRGADWLVGDSGHDFLLGGRRHDVAFLTGDGDLVLGGPSTSGFNGDAVSYGAVVRWRRQTTTGVNVDLVRGTGHLIGHHRVDRLFGIEDIFGTPFADVLRGDDLRNNFWGGRGNDIIRGRGGDDWMFAGPGNDQLYGGVGTDDLDGGSGADSRHP